MILQTQIPTPIYICSSKSSTFAKKYKLDKEYHPLVQNIVCLILQLTFNMIIQFHSNLCKSWDILNAKINGFTTPGYVCMYVYISWWIQWFKMFKGLAYDHMIIEYIVCTL